MLDANISEAEIIGALVRKLGGAANVARRIRRKPASIRMWRINGNVPYRWRGSILVMAEEMKVKLTPEEEDLLALLPEE